MAIHKLYIEAPDDMTGQDVVITIQGAFAWAIEDWQNCIEANEGFPAEQEPYQVKIERLESLDILEEEPNDTEGTS
jgi:hypothetical protein